MKEWKPRLYGRRLSWLALAYWARRPAVPHTASPAAASASGETSLLAPGTTILADKNLAGRETEAQITALAAQRNLTSWTEQSGGNAGTV